MKKGGPNGPPFLLPEAQNGCPTGVVQGALLCLRTVAGLSGGFEEPKNGRMLVAETGKMAEVARIIAPSLEAMGYAIVRVRLSGGGRPTLQIMAERADGAEMTVDDCADISRTVSALLDVEDPIAGA